MKIDVETLEVTKGKYGVNLIIIDDVINFVCYEFALPYKEGSKLQDLLTKALVEAEQLRAAANAEARALEKYAKEKERKILEVKIKALQEELTKLNKG